MEIKFKRFQHWNPYTLAIFEIDGVMKSYERKALEELKEQMKNEKNRREVRETIRKMDNLNKIISM